MWDEGQLGTSLTCHSEIICAHPRRHSITVRHVAIQTTIDNSERESESEPIPMSQMSYGSLQVAADSSSTGFLSPDSSLDKTHQSTFRVNRPILVKQKHSIQSSWKDRNYYSSEENHQERGGGPCETESLSNIQSSRDSMTLHAEEPVSWTDLKESVRNLPQVREEQVSDGNDPIVNAKGKMGTMSHHSRLGRRDVSLSMCKQTSMNEELICSERLKEKERLKRTMPKQCSLNEELIYSRAKSKDYETTTSTRWDQMKEVLFSSSNVRCLQLLRTELSNRFGSSTNNHNAGSNKCGLNNLDLKNGSDQHSNNGMTTVPETTKTDGNLSDHEWNGNSCECDGNVIYSKTTGQRGAGPSAGGSLKNGLVRILQNLKQGDEFMVRKDINSIHGGLQSSRRGSKDGLNIRRPLFPPFFSRRSSAGSLNISRGSGTDPKCGKLLSPTPHLKRRPSESEICTDSAGVSGTLSANGNNKLILPGVRHVRKLSREEGSDSSKDSSFQSDTSVDSEDSFASVIFIPKTNFEGDSYCFNSETRANSTDSERSPKSPANRLSPPYNASNAHALPKSPSPLASEVIRRQSPEMSPTVGPVFKELSATRFVFDDLTTVNYLSGCQDGSVLLTPPLTSVPHENALLTQKVEEHSKQDALNIFVQGVGDSESQVTQVSPHVS